MEKKTYFSPNQILAYPGQEIALGGRVNFTGVQPNERGRKIVPAGTPVGAETSFLDDSSVILSTATGENAQGLLLHDVDVTNGTANSPILIEGVVNVSRIDKSVSFSDDVKKKLDKITFVKR